VLELSPVAKTFKGFQRLGCITLASAWLVMINFYLHLIPKDGFSWDRVGQIRMSKFWNKAMGVSP
jgi:hypothetical protein